MKILVTGATHYHYPASVVKSLQQLGHEVKFVELIEFYKICNYFERRLYKLGVKSLETNYNRLWNDNFIKICSEFKPDLVFALNGIIMLENATLRKLHDLGIKLTIWLIDSIKRLSQFEDRIIGYDNVYSFEKDDLPYLKDKFGITSSYCPVGYDSDFYYPDSRIQRDIDISFIGNPTANRIQVLNEVAKYAQERKLSFQVYGLWWDNRFWKRNHFAHKYPVLASYIHNHLLSPSQVADIYKRTKICLNIHVKDHTGLNPRTFEILGTKSFQITEQRQHFDDIIRPNFDLETYIDMDDLISKMDYYLANDTERENIAGNGYDLVKERYTLVQMVKNIINKKNYQSIF